MSFICMIYIDNIQQCKMLVIFSREKLLDFKMFFIFGSHGHASVCKLGSCCFTRETKFTCPPFYYVVDSL